MQTFLRTSKVLLGLRIPKFWWKGSPGWVGLTPDPNSQNCCTMNTLRADPASIWCSRSSALPLGFQGPSRVSRIAAHTQSPETAIASSDPLGSAGALEPSGFYSSKNLNFLMCNRFVRLPAPTPVCKPSLWCSSQQAVNREVGLWPPN